MIIQLTTSIRIDWCGKKRYFGEGACFNAKPAYKWINGQMTNELDGYWIGWDSLRLAPAPGSENPGTLMDTKVFLHECRIMKE